MDGSDDRAAAAADLVAQAERQLDAHHRHQLRRAWRADPELRSEMHRLLSGLRARQRPPFLRALVRALTHAQIPARAVPPALAEMLARHHRREHRDRD